MSIMRLPEQAYGILLATLLICMLLFIPKAIGVGMSSHGGIRSAFDPRLIHEGGWCKKPFWVLRSAASPAWLMRARSHRILFFYNIREHGKGPPTCLFVMTRHGVKMIERGGWIRGEEIVKPWIVVSFTGAEGWNLFDVPWLIYLQRRPLLIRLTEDYLEISFRENDTGYICAMPLFGYLKVPQKDKRNSPIFGSKARSIRTWEWREKGTLPDDVVRRCEFWCRTFLRYPAGMWETFSVDRSKDLIIIKERYEWLCFNDDWGTKPLKFAAISPTLALACLYGFPVELSHELHDPDLYTPYGPLMGALGTDVIEMKFEILQYINEMEKPKMPDPSNEIAMRAIKRLRSVMRSRFPRSGEFDIDHGGGIWTRKPQETNYCWAVMGDIWYCRALPYLDEETREVVKSCLRRYFKDYVLTLKPYDPHRGKLLLHGPGIGSWGSWGDAGKFSTNLLQTIWAYAQFTGDWNLIRERWSLIKRFFILPEEMRWQGWGRYAIAELGDMAPPCIAMARMAWMVGDMDHYDFASYCFAKELVVHFVMSLGARYFYEYRPHDRPEPMDEVVFLTNIWGETAGWQIDGPRYPKKTLERQYLNRWVRFQCPDTARFYRDVKALRWAVEGELNDPELGWERFRDHMCVDDSHILPSFVRIRSLLLDEPPRKLAEICRPEDMRGSPSGIVASMIAYIRTSTPHEYVRIIPKEGRPSEFAPGLDRTGGWEYGVVEPIHDSDLVMTIRGPWATPAWRFWGDNGSDLYFGSITPFPDMSEGYVEEVALSWISSVRTFEPVKPRSLSEEELVKLLHGEKEIKWLLIGPFPNRMDKSLIKDAYPPEVKMNTSYVLGDKTYRWVEVRGVVFDLHELLSTDHGIAYILNYVFSPSERKAYLLVGTSGGCRVWVNNELMFSWHRRHEPFRKDNFRVIVHLRRGWNKILVKIEGAWGYWRASCRITYGDGMPFGDLVFDPYHGFKGPRTSMVKVKSLFIEPREVFPSEVITVRACLVNISNRTVRHTIYLLVDNKLLSSKEIELRANKSMELIFTIDTEELNEGAHYVVVDGVRESFVIKRGNTLTVCAPIAVIIVTAIIVLALALRRVRNKEA